MNASTMVDPVFTEQLKLLGVFEDPVRHIEDVMAGLSEEQVRSVKDGVKAMMGAEFVDVMRDIKLVGDPSPPSLLSRVMAVLFVVVQCSDKKLSRSDKKHVKVFEDDLEPHGRHQWNGGPFMYITEYMFYKREAMFEYLCDSLSADSITAGSLDIVRLKACGVDACAKKWLGRTYLLRKSDGIPVETGLFPELYLDPEVVDIVVGDVAHRLPKTIHVNNPQSGKTIPDLYGVFGDPIIDYMLDRRRPGSQTTSPQYQTIRVFARPQESPLPAPPSDSDFSDASHAAIWNNITLKTNAKRLLRVGGSLIMENFITNAAAAGMSGDALDKHVEFTKESWSEYFDAQTQGASLVFTKLESRRPGFY